MRNRHIPRTCQTCHAPMASGIADCWRCGVEWAEEGQPAVRLRLVADPAGDLPVAEPAMARAAAAAARSY